MTPRERFVKTLSGERPDRLPVVEWASWWDKTVARWRGEGMPELSGTGMMEYFGLDVLHQFWLPHRKPGLPSPAYNGAPIIETEDDYERIKPYLFPEDAVTLAEHIREVVGAELEPFVALVIFAMQRLVGLKPGSLQRNEPDPRAFTIQPFNRFVDSFLV